VTAKRTVTGPRECVALLRGINVGGRNRLPMKDLAALFADAGCTHVRTYIQSGNVVFGAPAALSRRLPKVAAEGILERFGLSVPVVVRTATELRAVARSHPFHSAATDPKLLHVAFLADRPTAGNIAALDPDRSPPDRFEVRGREIYLHTPNGVARTKLSNDYFDAKLATTCTMRNWKTVLALTAMLDER